MYYNHVKLLQVDKILKIIPKERRTYLYSATMTKKVLNLFVTCFFT